MDARNLIGLFILFILLNIMIAISIVILHEAGHAVIGTVVGCKDIETLIKYPSFDVSTELTCEKGMEIIPWGAFLFTLPFSLFFIFIQSPERKLFWIAFGLALFTATQDVVIATNLNFFFPLLLAIGFGLILYGEDELIRDISLQSETISS